MPDPKTAFLLKDIYSGGKESKLLAKKGWRVTIVSESKTVAIVRILNDDKGFSVFPSDLSK